MELERYEGNIFEKIEHTLYLLEEEWNCMNLPEHQRDKRRLVVFNGLHHVCDTALANEKSIKKKILKRIEDHKDQLFHLGEELNVSYVVIDDMPMLDLDKHLQEKICELLEVKEMRLTQLKALVQRNKVVCSFLGENPFNISENSIPSEEAIEMLRKHIQEMEQEKIKRIDTYKTLRMDILGFVELLKRPIEGGILLDIVCNTQQEDLLTKAHLMEVRKLHSDLEFDVKEMESYSLELREKISLLWILLKIPSDKQESFLSSVPLHNSSSIEKLECHLSELKEIRLQNLGKFIKELKFELQKWWEKCLVGEDQKKSFFYIDSEDITEEILDAYESEVKKWKNFYQDNCVIFEKVEHLLGLFDMMQQLEERAKDPSRLFNTRGGTLLQEEKERKRVRQELPIVQEQLLHLCQNYDASNDTPFRIDGETVEEYLSKLWDYHNLLKEKEKVDRQTRTKAGITPKPVNKGVTGKNPTIVITPAGSRKRLREGSDLESKFSSKRVAKTPSAGPYLQSPMQEQRTPTRAGSLRKTKMALKERNTLPPPSSRKNLLGSDDALHSPLSYDNFKAALSNANSKEIVHSSILCSESTITNDEILSNDCGEVKTNTDKKRALFLKTTLNLASPMKSGRKLQAKISVTGGASGGTYLVRSSSQPSVNVSPCKILQSQGRKVWKP